MRTASDVDFALAGASESQLLEVLAGQSDRFLPSEAIDEIRRRPSPRLISGLVDVLTGRSGDPSVRWAAAVALADQSGEERQQALLVALDDPEPEVVRRAAQGLGRIGDARALERLATVETYDSEATRRAVSFARTLLSYRLSRGTHRLTFPPASEFLDVDKTVPLRVRPPDPSILRKAIADLEKISTPGVAVDDRSAMAVACRGDHLLVLFAQELAEARDLRSLRRDLVVALVLLRHAEGGYRLHEYLLAHPADADMVMFGVRSSGRLVHAGTARIDPERAEFQLRAVNTVLSPPVAIEGTYSTGMDGVRLTRADVNLRFGASQKRPVVLPRPRRGPPGTREPRGE